MQMRLFRAKGLTGVPQWLFELLMYIYGRKIDQTTKWPIQAVSEVLLILSKTAIFIAEIRKLPHQQNAKSYAVNFILVDAVRNYCDAREN